MVKPHITIIHGWAYSVEKWQSFVLLLEKAGYTCTLLKVPGLTGGIDRVWTLEDYITWLDGQLQGDGPHILLGHSNGGRIALGYTHRFPQKVRSLILVDSAGILHTDLKTRTKKTIFKLLATIGKVVTQSAVLKKLLYKLAREQDYYQASPVMKQTMQNLIAVDVAPWLTAMSLPVLLIWGAQDQLTPLADGKKLERLLPHAQLHVLSTARHSPQLTHPQETAELIITHLPELL